jgi:hypothetical protein
VKRGLLLVGDLRNVRCCALAMMQGHARQAPSHY